MTTKIQLFVNCVLFYLKHIATAIASMLDVWFSSLNLTKTSVTSQPFFVYTANLQHLYLRFLLKVLDSGVTTSLDDFQRVCDPKLVVFDLRTDQIVRTIILPRQVLRPSSLLTNLVIDEEAQGRCDSAFVYMSDTASPGKKFCSYRLL